MVLRVEHFGLVGVSILKHTMECPFTKTDGTELSQSMDNSP